MDFAEAQLGPKMAALDKRNQAFVWEYLKNGSMDMDERRQVQEAFAREARILISTDAGGEGLNLQFCHVIVNFDMPWNPMRIEQRIGRVDRIGQKHVVRAINFGIWAFLIVPLLRSLNWIHSIVGNYGWSIVILTILINALMFPLRHKSVVSMRKMQEIQPEAKAIQDRYAHLKATDPAKQKMNQELMALYRERGINPASGCVPMLLTLPVLFGFYSLLTTAIELRGAPFGLWIQDLSAPDRYYVTPILMGLSQLWQQRLTPQTGVDPAQQKMMMFMPLVFTFIFFSAPSGAVVYWLVSNGWQIGQQYVTNYLIGPPTIRAPRPAAERRLSAWQSFCQTLFCRNEFLYLD